MNLESRLRKNYNNINPFDTGNCAAHPIYCAKVDSFGKVEALVEAAVICSWKSDDELSCALIGSVNLKAKEQASP